MSKPKEQLFKFQHWQAEPLDEKTKPAAPTPPAESPAAASPTPEATPQLKLPTVDEIERMHEDARRSGYEEGLAEGKLAAEQAMREATKKQAERFGHLISNLESALLEVEQSVAEQLLNVGIEIASQVTRGTITANTELLLPVIREAIAALPLHHAHLIFRLNPVDAQPIRASLGEQFAQTGTQIIEDREISPGGCMLQAGTSEVDATIETRWKRVLESIGTEPQKWLTP
jgi:flagellar assembly protein FliH